MPDDVSTTIFLRYFWRMKCTGDGVWDAKSAVENDSIDDNDEDATTVIGLDTSDRPNLYWKVSEKPYYRRKNGQWAKRWSLKSSNLKRRNGSPENETLEWPTIVDSISPPTPPKCRRGWHLVRENFPIIYTKWRPNDWVYGINKFFIRSKPRKTVGTLRSSLR